MIHVQRTVTYKPLSMETKVMITRKTLLLIWTFTAILFGLMHYETDLIDNNGIMIRRAEASPHASGWTAYG
ncbi:MAG: hypothetical protein JXK07_04995 [Spirochaetes bacterium]|nr:hypothetical protein [Spirochaetota bacterium]